MQIIVQFNFLVLSFCYGVFGGSLKHASRTPIESIADTVTKDHCRISVDLSNLYLGPLVNSNFISSPHVKNLTLSKNNIIGFSEGAFDSIPNLEYLDLSYNKLKLDQLFSFGQHSNLKILILDGNLNSYYNTTNTSYESIDYSWQGVDEWQLNTSTPASTDEILRLNSSYKFPQLKHLSLKGINIQDISTRFNLTFANLSYLDLSMNKLNRNVLNNIPPTVTTLIMENVGFTDLELNPLKNIRTLNVNGNIFYSVGRYCHFNTLCLQDSQNLQKLYISRCSINKIEVDAFKDTSNLLELDLSDNRIMEIANGTLDCVKSLNRLDLSRTPLLEVPDLNVLTNLTTLILDGMLEPLFFFDSLQSSKLPKLHILSMRNNNLKDISKDLLNNLQFLQELDLSSNKIMTLPAGQWQSTLCKLDISFNSIESFDDMSLNKVEALKVLNINNNKISNIKVKSIKKLADDAIITI